MIPCTTVEEREREIMFFNCGWRPDRDFVGGVCLDGKYLTASMDYEAFHNEVDEGRPDTGAGRSLPIYHCSLTANKSWFFFDRAILCLGSDIFANDGYRVRTIIENRALSSDEFIVADGKRIDFAECEISLLAQRIFIPHTGGFIFPEGGNITVKFYENAGVRYVSIWLDHGVDPEDKKYAYVVLPNVTEEEALCYDIKDIEILQNDGKIQAAQEKSSGLCGIVFRSPSEFEDITADHPMIAMLRRDESEEINSLVACDPTQRLNKLYFSVASASPLFSADPCVELTHNGDVLRAVITPDSARGRAFEFKAQ